MSTFRVFLLKSFRVGPAVALLALLSGCGEKTPAPRFVPASTRRAVDAKPRSSPGSAREATVPRNIDMH
jgi:predicted small lipoprotein YifL